jgi:hypothetical protein
MKTFATALTLLAATLVSYGQVGSEIPCLDSIEFTVTNYPVKLTNDRKDLQKTLTEKVILYPEDKSLNDKYTYLISVDCNGKATKINPLRTEGSGFLDKRLQKEILLNCTWQPAVHQDYRVASFYKLIIEVEKGKCKIIDPKTQPGVRSP